MAKTGALSDRVIDDRIIGYWMIGDRVIAFSD
jgi:hypothetical protein